MIPANSITKISELWYIKTPVGYDGPFKDILEVNRYLSLLICADAARGAFTNLQHPPE